jgi:glycosyltransferase involved in cell wall biosynthesis
MARGFGYQVTAVLLCYNEAPNIERVLAKLDWVAEIVVLDSGSDDGTLDVLARHANVRCLYRRFDSHASQWNYAIAATGIATEWVLALDADYILTDALVEEMVALDPAPELCGYKTQFIYCMSGRPVRGTLYPPVTTLYRRASGHYQQDGHTQRLQLAGRRGDLRARIMHDDRKPLSRWLRSQEQYAGLEADFLLGKSGSELNLQDRLRRMLIVTPWLVPLYCLTVRRGLLDGLPGVYYALQRGVAETVLSMKLIEARLQRLRR